MSAPLQHAEAQAQLHGQLHVFMWGALSHVAGNKQFYNGFTLNGIEYALGDAVCLRPETEGSECYIGRLNASFRDLTPGVAEPHCIEIRWFERLVILDERLRGQPDKERELMELEETDINPIGSISGKCVVLRTRTYDEALKLAKGCAEPWFFSRGQYHQDTRTLVPYADLLTGLDGKSRARSRPCIAMPEEDVADSEDTRSSKKARMDSAQLNNSRPAGSSGDVDIERTTGRKKGQATGYVSSPLPQYSTVAQQQRSCVECGATQTPQWREGPQGPKTLCNACGVRYGRQQNRAGKRCGGAGVSRATLQAARSGSTGLPQVAKASSVIAAVNQSKQGGPRDRVMLNAARPVRQAAMVSASRTAKYARTGNFSDSVLELTHLNSKTPSPPPPSSAILDATDLLASNVPPRPGSAAASEAVKLEHGAAAAAMGGDVVDRGMFSHESSHTSVESAQDNVMLSPTLQLNEVNAARVFSLCYGRQQEADTPAQGASGDLTSTDVDDNVMLGLDSSTNMLLSNGSVGFNLSALTTASKPAQMQLAGEAAMKPQAPLDTVLAGTEPTGGDAGSDAGAGGPVDLRAVAARASLWMPSMNRFLGVLSCIEEARSVLPPTMLDNLESLGRAVEAAAAEATAADAALAAVHQVLLARQREAAKARSDAMDVIGKMRNLVTHLVDRHPQLALQGGLQSELGCLPGLNAFDDELMSGMDALLPVGMCGGPGGIDDPCDVPNYDDVVLGSVACTSRSAAACNTGDISDVLAGGNRGGTASAAAGAGDEHGSVGGVDLDDLVGMSRPW